MLDIHQDWIDVSLSAKVVILNQQHHRLFGAGSWAHMNAKHGAFHLYQLLIPLLLFSVYYFLDLDF